MERLSEINAKLEVTESTRRANIAPLISLGERVTLVALGTLALGALAVETDMVEIITRGKNTERRL